MSVFANLVKELRERTGLGILDCKQALDATNGDLELAIDELRKSSALKAAKKAGRTTANGLLGLKVADDGTRAAMVEVNIETDFAAKNDKFIGFVEAVLNAAYESNDDLDKLLAGGLDAKREALVQEIGENVTVRRVAALDSVDGFIASYLHNDKRKATLVELSTQDGGLGRDLAMHITAHDPTPLVVQAADLDQAVVTKERAIYQAQADESGKPQQIVEKIVEGRVRKFLAEVSLVDQAFVKDSGVRVGELLQSQDSECRRFVRFEVGEGIEIAAEDFAAEVAAQIKETQ